MHGAVLLLRLGLEAEARLARLQLVREELRRVTPDLGAMLEAVAGAGAYQQQVRGRGVVVDQQVAVRAVLVLADALLGELRAGERGKTLCQVGPRIGQCPGRGDSITPVRIDDGPCLSCATLKPRDSVARPWWQG